MKTSQAVTYCFTTWLIFHSFNYKKLKIEELLSIFLIVVIILLIIVVVIILVVIVFLILVISVVVILLIVVLVVVIVVVIVHVFYLLKFVSIVCLIYGKLFTS